MQKKALITGITSQDGAYLAELLLQKGYKVIGLVRSTHYLTTNYLKKLNIENNIEFEVSDILDAIGLTKIFTKYKFDEVYHLAAQSSVSQSFQQPFTTIHFNSIATLNLLEIIRIINKDIKFLQPSSSEMYGKNIELPINEKSILKPNSPYAISKATSFWTVNSYRESYSLFASNAILFNHESIFRSNNFFIKKVINSAIQIKYGKLDNLKLGNIEIKRDFGYAPEYVKAMWLILNHTEPDNFIVSSGKSYLLREIVEYVFDKLNLNKNKIIIDPKLYRPSEIEDIYGDNSKIKNKLNWEYNIDFFEILDLLIDAEIENFQ